MRLAPPSRARFCQWPLRVPAAPTPCQHPRHASSSRSTSSKLWLQRQKNDPFVRARGDDFVSRSAFKLLELQTKSRNTLLRPGMTVVDLGAAPGGWVQAAAQSLTPSRKPSRIIAVDLLPLHPTALALPQVAFIRGDFLDLGTQASVRAALGPHDVDLVLSDMLANLSGNHGRDAQLSLDLCQAALKFAVAHLAPPPPSSTPSSTTGPPCPPSCPTTRGAKSSPAAQLVIKFLQSDLTPTFAATLRTHFTTVRWDKPSSSRAESREGYWVCSGFRGRTAPPEPEAVKEVAEENDSLFF